MSIRSQQQPSRVPSRPLPPRHAPVSQTRNARAASPAPDAVGQHTLLQLGSRGSEVKDLQGRLKAAGFKVPQSGVFDAKTDAAVRAYQQSKGLQVDGKVGQQTWGSFLGQRLPPGVSMLKNGAARSGHSPVDSFSGKPAGKPSSPTGTSGTSAATPFSGSATPAMQRLAQAGHAAAMSMGGYSSEGLCATGVSRAINNAFGINVTGNGNTIGANLPTNRFKEVNMSLQQALKIPGLVLTWQHTPTAEGSLYGHTAITSGDGHSSSSDFIENDTLSGSVGRSGLHIYMPIG